MTFIESYRGIDIYRCVVTGDYQLYKSNTGYSFRASGTLKACRSYIDDYMFEVLQGIVGWNSCQFGASRAGKQTSYRLDYIYHSRRYLTVREDYLLQLAVF